MAVGGNSATRVVLLGTYDLGKPRTRLLRQALRTIDPDLLELHVDVWRGVEDKSILAGFGSRLWIGLKLLLAYPWLALRYLFASRHDLVVIGYMGLFDMLLLAPLVKLRGKPVVWDAFLSIYDTWARDRAMGAEDSWKARLLRWMERRACGLADAVVLDTMAHAELMGELHHVAEDKLAAVLVGAETSAFAPATGQTSGENKDRLEVLFYGQFIPLHGIDTIIDAALNPRGKAYDWTIIGQGQEAARIDARLAHVEAPQVQRIDWVDYERLGDHLLRADLCLGIFGTSDKAARVIPNKVYQTFLSGKPLITRDSPAIRELVADDQTGVYLVPPADPARLLDAIENFARERGELPDVLHADLCDEFSIDALTDQWRHVLEKALAR